MGGHNEDTANSMINAIAVIKPPKACFPVIVGKTVIQIQRNRRSQVGKNSVQNFIQQREKMRTKPSYVIRSKTARMATP